MSTKANPAPCASFAAAHEVRDELLEIVVFEQPDARWKATIENRMGAGRQRRRTIVDVGARVAARVRELQTDEKVGVRRRAEPFAVRGDERLSQAGDRAPASRASSSADCGFARPSCRTATASQPHINLAPLMPKCRQRRRGQLARLAGRRAVPAFHRQDAETIADPSAVDRRSGAQAASPRVAASTSSNSSAIPLLARCVRNAAEFLREAMRGIAWVTE